MHKLLSRQLRSTRRADGSLDAEALIAAVERSYDEFDRERRLNDRLVKLMEEDLDAANEKVKRLGELRLSETLESTPVAVLLISAKCVLQNINLAMLAICAPFGFSPRRGDAFAEILRKIAPEGDAGGIIQRLFGGEDIELRISRNWYLSRARAMTDGSFAVSFSDITALKDREGVLATARDAAESANRLKSKFLATMSHELRTPLNAILGFSEVIHARGLGDGKEAWARYVDYAEAINSSGQHLLSLICEVLDLSKIESGSYRLRVETLDLSQIIRESLSLVRIQADRAKVRILPVKTSGDLSLDADYRAVKQILVNLLSNAVKFTPEHGEVEIAASEEGGNIAFSVRDTGIGIPPEQLQNVFEPFHQGDAQIARRFEGTGLGLSITLGLVRMHGGELTVESEPNVGTTVNVSLPRRAASPAECVA